MRHNVSSLEFSRDSVLATRERDVEKAEIVLKMAGDQGFGQIRHAMEAEMPEVRIGDNAGPWMKDDITSPRSRQPR